MSNRVFFAATAFSILFLIVAGFYSETLAVSYQNNAESQLLPPEFSAEAGYKSAEFTVELTHPDSEAQIRYTLDGSEPGPDSKIYENEIGFSDAPENNLMFIQTTPDEAERHGYSWKWPPENIPGAFVVRARAFKAGHPPSETATRTYLNADYEHDLPVISIAVDRDHLFSDETGIYVPGNVYKELGWPQNDFWGRPNANYHQTGIEWERPASFELIEKDGTRHAQNIGLRMHGDGSRAQPQKSFRLYSRSEYGESRFNYDMFLDGETGYNRLILRNSGQDFFSSATMYMDAFAQTLVSDLSFDTMKYRPFVIYINGEYWGIKNMRERYDRHYLERNYGVEEGTIDYLSSNQTNYSEIKEGSADYYEAVIDSLEQFHVDDLGGFGFIERHIDVQNFTEFYAAQIFFSNVDWPGNNNDYWRYNGPPESKGSAKDGRFRWMMFDMDFGMGYLSTSNYDNDMFEHLLSGTQTNWANPVRTTLMFRSFVKNRHFLETYINTQMDLLNSHLRQERTISRLFEMKAVLENEISRHMERWGYPASFTSWESHIKRREIFLKNRHEHLLSHMQNRFDVGNPVEITVENPDRHLGNIRVNNIVLAEETPGIPANPFPWTGTYFDEVPIVLTALPVPGFMFESWEINGERHYSQQLSLKPEAGKHIRVHFAEMPDPTEDDRELIYFWYFGEDIPNDTPLEILPVTFSSNNYEAFLKYQPAIFPYPPADLNNTEGIMDRVNDPTGINYRPEGNSGLEFDEEDMRGIRVRNPSRVEAGNEERESAIILEIPTLDFDDIILAFAANRTTNGQEKMQFFYSITEGEPDWKQENISLSEVFTTFSYGIYVIDFSDVFGHRHNPWFKVKISFDGENVYGNDGNTRFNNIGLFGIPYSDPRLETLTKSRLFPNFPNPFSNITTIEYGAETNSNITIDIYNLMGQRISRLVDAEHQRGIYAVEFDGTGYASGVYLVRLLADDNIDLRKMMLIK